MPRLWLLGLAGVLLGLLLAAGGVVHDQPPGMRPSMDATDSLTDPEAQARWRSVIRRGAARGNHLGVFAKVGDSMTASPAFLVNVGCGRVGVPGFEDTVRFFTATPVSPPAHTAECGPVTSLTRASQAARPGWTARDVLAPVQIAGVDCPGSASSPLACELDELRPSLALVMFGTNEILLGRPVAAFIRDLEAVINEIEARGTLPVLSTLPPLARAGLGARVPVYSTAIVELARRRQLPLWDYHAAMQEGTKDGPVIDDDGVHPSARGYAIRDRSAVHVLAALRPLLADSTSEAALGRVLGSRPSLGMP